MFKPIYLFLSFITLMILLGHTEAISNYNTILSPEIIVCGQQCETDVEACYKTGGLPYSGWPYFSTLNEGIAIYCINTYVACHNKCGA